jgi:hypothetical protein
MKQTRLKAAMRTNSPSHQRSCSSEGKLANLTIALQKTYEMKYRWQEQQKLKRALQFAPAKNASIQSLRAPRPSKILQRPNVKHQSELYPDAVREHVER